VGSSWNLNASNFGRLIHYVTQQNHCNVCPVSQPLHERAHILQPPLFESNKELVLVADGSQPILDAGAGFLAREMFCFDISVFNGVVLWRYLSADGS
jgi:hypothetical protein